MRRRILPLTLAMLPLALWLGQGVAEAGYCVDLYPARGLGVTVCSP